MKLLETEGRLSRVFWLTTNAIGGDKEVSSNCSERLPVQPDTPEYSTVENVPESARRLSTLIPQVKRMVQPLISVRMKLWEPCEEDWGQEIYSNSSNFVFYNDYGKLKVATFGQLWFSLVNHSLFTGSNVSNIPTVKLSDLENISQPVETCAIDGGRRVRPKWLNTPAKLTL